MDVKSLYDAGKLSDSQMVRLVRLGTLGNKLGITVDEFEEITGKSIETVISLEEAKQLQHGTINGKREANRATAVVEYAGDTFEVNKTSQENMNSIATAAILDIQNGGNTTFAYRSATNVNHDFTAAQIIQLALLMVSKVSEVYGESWALKALVDAADTVKEVLAVTEIE